MDMQKAYAEIDAMKLDNVPAKRELFDMFLDMYYKSKNEKDSLFANGGLELAELILKKKGYESLTKLLREDKVEEYKAEVERVFKEG